MNRARCAPEAAVLQETVVPILIVGIVFSFTAIMVATIFYALHRGRQLRHETIRLALEKGQVLPPELLRDAEAARRPRTDLSRGVILLALGAGTSLFLWTLGIRSWGAGLILVALGLGYAVSHLLTSGERGAARSEPPPAR
jgi:uncharacterized protein DUF6249